MSRSKILAAVATFVVVLLIVAGLIVVRSAGPEVPKLAGAVTSVCEDQTGDQEAAYYAGDDFGDIKRVTMQATEQELRITFVLKGAVPRESETNSVGYDVRLQTVDGQDASVRAVRSYTSGGSPWQVTVQDNDRFHQATKGTRAKGTALPPNDELGTVKLGAEAVEQDDNYVTVTVPRVHLPDVRGSVRWMPYVDQTGVIGDDVMKLTSERAYDYCPGKRTLSPEALANLTMGVPDSFTNMLSIVLPGSTASSVEPATTSTTRPPQATTAPQASALEKRIVRESAERLPDDPLASVSCSPKPDSEDGTLYCDGKQRSGRKLDVLTVPDQGSEWSFTLGDKNCQGASGCLYSNEIDAAALTAAAQDALGNFGTANCDAGPLPAMRTPPGGRIECLLEQSELKAVYAVTGPSSYKLVSSD